MSDVKSCEFIKSLTAEQKAGLRKLLDEDTASKPVPYEVRHELWPNGKLKTMQEYKYGKKDGKGISWDERGEKILEVDWKDDCIFIPTYPVYPTYPIYTTYWPYSYGSGSSSGGHYTNT